MKLQFDSNQAYQLDAVQSVVEVFEGQQKNTGEHTSFHAVEKTSGQLKGLLDDVHFCYGNQISITEQEVVSNVQRIQDRWGIEKSELKDDVLKDGMNFSVEMETGTGKTYVYLRTIHELYEQYGFSKFVIVVPSIAIKEGVKKNLEITADHFAMLYNKPKMDFYVWDSKKRGQMRQFATANSLQILIINIDSFTKKNVNIIHKQSDWGTPIEFLRATNPIVIVDEPQNMETEKRQNAIAELNPLCTLRYSATHKNTYNLLYSLDPIKAYDLGLVKRIEVDSIVSEDAYSHAYIHVEKIKATKTKVSAKIEIDRSDEFGLQRRVMDVTVGDDIQAFSDNREVYEGYVIDEIDPQEKTVTFSNGKVFYEGQRDDGVRESVVKFQIQQTIENHFDKELSMKGKGVKVLSLFFIDKVKNYREYSENGAVKGKFAEWFEESYNHFQAQDKYKGLIEFSAEEVHDGYFSADKGGWKDTKGNTKADNDTYQLIMKDKERLLNVKEPLRFIFSHSALREGWDSPNVFNICTINETKSEMKKRQEIGRGLRLPVNSEGERIWDPDVNILTVVANESYEDFARGLQTEMEDAYGIKFDSSRIKNKRKRRKVKLKKQYQLDENFKDLWERIKHKTTYRVEYSTKDLIEKASERARDIVVQRPKLTRTKTRVTITQKGVGSEGVARVNAGRVEQELKVVPDVLGVIQKNTKLTKGTILEILKKSGQLNSILVNPQKLIDELSVIIRKVREGLMVDGVKYEKVEGEAYEMKRFADQELEGYLDGLVTVQDQDKTLYNYIAVDSDVERDFAGELESREDVKFYFKLPHWFKIKTPIGNYNPDWALVLENDKRVYFVAETKSTRDLFDEKLRESERQKIKCGKKHFEQLDGVVFAAPVVKLDDFV